MGTFLTRLDTTRQLRCGRPVRVLRSPCPSCEFSALLLLEPHGSVAGKPAREAAVVRTVEQIIQTQGPGDAVDVTGEVARAVAASGVTSGVVTVFVKGSTAGFTTIEFESGVVADLDRALETVAPRQADYQHHLRWGDDNGSAHVRAGIVGPSLTVPFRDGQLLLGTWQQIALLEFDTRPRTRRYIVQIVGD